MLQIYTIQDADKWDNIVKTFKDYDVYWLSGYVKAFQIHGDGEPLLFYYEDENVKGINVVMKRDIAKDKHFENILEPNKYYDFATPYGYGGWLIEGENSKQLFIDYEQWCKNNNIVSEFVRFHPVVDNQRFSVNSYEVIPLGQTIALDLSSKDVIWDNITSKNRNVIRKAIKNGVKIYSSRNIEIYKKFIGIYNATMDKDNADKYYYFGEDFYKSILYDLKHNAQVFYAELDDGTIIATSIMIYANGRMNYHLSGSLREYQNLAPSNLLLYEAALWGNANGYKTLHLGGGVGSGEDSLYKFKSAFNRNSNYRYHIGKKVFLQDEYQKLVSSRKEIQSEFFPKYRAD